MDNAGIRFLALGALVAFSMCIVSLTYRTAHEFVMAVQQAR